MDGRQSQLNDGPETGNTDEVDLLVIGGGINGVGIARDAAGRGLSVVLCERGDLGGATSSASSKLIHGGLRYLEQYDFRLVRKALKEREVLMAAAPHLVEPMRFILPHSPRDRPAWMIRLGLFLYDHIGGARTLPGSEGIDLHTHEAGVPLRETYRRGFAYSDCWTDDARLVVTNAIDAGERGAEVLTRTELVSARRKTDHWTATLRDTRTNQSTAVNARILVNAAGPWAAEVITGRLGQNTSKGLRLVKGSHIVVPKLAQGRAAYLLQNHDGRVIFVLPFQEDYSLIGTTDVELDEMPEDPAISEDEVSYLCAAVADYFDRPPVPDDVIWSFAGVRPLFNDDDGNPSDITRDYTLELVDDGPPLLSVLGGKLTTYRVLAETAMNMLAPFTGKPQAWTASAVLPGGDMPDGDMAAFEKALQGAYPWMDSVMLHRWARAYGTRVRMILPQGAGPEALGADLGGGVCEAELQYLVRHEWTETADDLLWRRTKLGLGMSEDDKNRIAAAMERVVTPGETVA